MTITQLQQVLNAALNKSGDIDVAIDFATFYENDCGTILEVESAKVLRVQPADDSGPVGRKEPFLVLSGGAERHAHGDPI